MPKPHPRAELHQPRPYGRFPGLCGDPHPRRGPPHQQQVTRRIRRRQRQQPPRLGRQTLQLPPETVLDPPRQRHRRGQPEPARQLRRSQPPRQLQQRQRVTPRLGHDQVPHPRIQRPGQRRIQQRPRILLPQPRHRQLRQPGQLRPRHPGREHQAHRLGRQPPRHKPQRLHRGPVQPLLVIDHAHQRPLAGHLRHQPQHRQPHQEPVRRRAAAEAERGPQRLLLRPRQALQPVQHRRQQLMQPGERQLHLRLHPRRPHHPAPRRPPGQVIQQHGLAYPGLTAHHQHPAAARPHRVNQLIQHAAFTAPVRQPARASAPSGILPHRPGTTHPWHPSRLWRPNRKDTAGMPHPGRPARYAEDLMAGHRSWPPDNARRPRC